MTANIPVKSIQVKSVLSKSNLPVWGFSVNPYIWCTHGCRYCYASFMKRFTWHTEEWWKFLDIKYREPIKNPQKYRWKSIFIGSVTDPYLPLEEKYWRTRAFLEEIRWYDVGISIATKSDLILRDLELIQSFKDARVSWSINTLDEEFKNDMDYAVSIQRRIEAMKQFHAAWVRTTCFISPIFPWITKVKEIIEATKEHCNLIWLENLNLRGDYKVKILKYIKEKYPALHPLYDEIYNKKSRNYREMLNQEIEHFCKKENLLYLRNNDNIQRPFHEPPIVVNYFYHEEIKKSAK